MSVTALNDTYAVVLKDHVYTCGRLSTNTIHCFRLSRGAICFHEA